MKVTHIPGLVLKVYIFFYCWDRPDVNKLCLDVYGVCRGEFPLGGLFLLGGLPYPVGTQEGQKDEDNDDEDAENSSSDSSKVVVHICQ